MSEYDVRSARTARAARRFRYRDRVRVTKEIEASELEKLTKPEARETAAFDAAELAGLLDQSRRDDDDLAAPATAARTASGTRAPRPEVEQAEQAELVVSAAARARSLVPWIVVGVAAVVVIVLVFLR